MFKVIVDSAANIPAVIAEKYGIDVISFINNIEGKEVTCYDPALSPEQEREAGKRYYDEMRAGMSIKTGLISIAEFTDHFSQAINEGLDVIYFTLSSGISGTRNSARLAAEDVMENAPEGRVIRVIDTLNASLAQGILAIYAAEMRDQGYSTNETADKLEALVGCMNGIFTVGDLKYLAHTGRISKATALIGNTLNLKPILRGDKEGHIVSYKKCRGRKSALNALVNLVCENIVDPENQIIGIAHADAYEDSLYVMEQIQEKIKVRGFINTSYDFCTGSHVGPDTVALFFLGKNRELEGSHESLSAALLSLLDIIKKFSFDFLSENLIPVTV